MTFSAESVRKKAEEIFEWVRQIRRELHMYPEAGMQEYKTSEIICRTLDELGIPYRKGIANTGIVGLIKGANEEQTVALRADMDGLPIVEANDVEYKSKNHGFMHACGHDAHVAVQLGTARVLNNLKEKLPCNVKLLFQPAEESCGGALPMIQEGVLKDPDVDYIFGLHTDSGQESGIVSMKYGVSQAAVDTFKIRVIGKSAHGAHPASGVDAIVIAGNIITAIQTIVSRNISANDNLVITLGTIKGGDKENIIAENVVIEGTMRSLNSVVRDHAAERLKEIVQNTAKAYGGNGEVDISQEYCPLINNDSVMSYVEENAVSIVGKDKIAVYETPSMGGEDYAFFLKEVPGAFFKFGTKNTNKKINAPAHNCFYDIEEDSMKTAVAMQVLNVLNIKKLNRKIMDK